MSPHRDDAGLSVAATLSRLVSLGVSLTIVSCFTRSQWAPFAPPGTSEAEVTAIRAAEDQSFVKLLGRSARLISLDLLDGPLRDDWIPYRSWPETSPEPISEHVRALVAEKLTGVLPQGAVRLLPLALEHRDHLIVRAAGLSIAPHGPLLFYEDVPYVFWFSERDVRGQVERLERVVDTALQPLIIHDSEELESWAAAARIYASQFSALQVASMSRLLQARGGERVWVNVDFLRWIDALRSPAAR